MLENAQQALPLFTGQVVYLLPSRNFRQLYHHRDQLLGQKIVQRILEIVVCVFAEVRQQPFIQLLLIQSRFQIDFQPILLFIKVPHMGGSRQDQWTADAEVGEQQLSEIRVEFLIVFKHRQADIPQAQPLQTDAGNAGGNHTLQWHQRPPQRRDGVSRLRCQTVAVPGGACAGIADAAGGQNHSIGGVASPFPGDAAYRAVRNLQRNRPIPDDAYPQGFQPPFQCGADVKGAVADREYPVSPLRFQRDAQSFKKCHGIGAGEVSKSTVKEFSITRNIGQQPFDICVVGHVAPAFAGDIQFFPQPLVRFQQRYLRSLFRGGNGRHHPGGAAANHHDPITHHPHRQILHIDPTGFPAWKTSPLHRFPSSWRSPPAAR